MKEALGRTALVVDDNIDAAAMLTALLTSMGFAVRQAYDSASALALAETQKPDVVLTDLLMPKTGGVELVGKMRQLPGLQNTRFIAVSGYVPADWEPDYHGHFDGFLRKPFSADELEALLNRCSSYPSARHRH